MPDLLTTAAARLASHGELSLPLLFSLWMAGMDLVCRRIPNYLTLGAALAGLGFQLGYRGLPGLLDGLLGAVLGLLLLLWPYLKGGMGAGDVKALAALGAWLGLVHTFFLFIFMGLSGGLIIILILARQGRLWAEIRKGATLLINLVLCRTQPEFPAGLEAGRQEIPYGAALALGMACLYWRAL